MKRKHRSNQRLIIYWNDAGDLLANDSFFCKTKEAALRIVKKRNKTRIHRAEFWDSQGFLYLLNKQQTNFIKSKSKLNN